MGGSFPIDLVLFGMIAAFLVLRLRSILGRRTGYERPPQAVQPQAVPRTAPGPVIDGRAESDRALCSADDPRPGNAGRTVPAENAGD